VTQGRRLARVPLTAKMFGLIIIAPVNPKITRHIIDSISSSRIYRGRGGHTHHQRIIRPSSSAMSFLPSSVRLLSPSPIIIFTRHVSGSHRYVKGGKPKPALAPLLRSPHHPKLPLRSSGASQPHPRDLSPSYTPTTSSVPLDNGLVLHHSPPASAPSHMTGSVPPLLKWLGGESVRLTGEEEAPALRGWEPARGDVVAGWSEELKERMREMRARGMSRADIARR